MSEIEWNEQDYLSKNPDVAQAVKQGSFKSGLDHFLAFGKYEDRSGAPIAKSIKQTSAEFRSPGPWPPEHLRLRVHGARDLEGYMSIGKTVAQDLEWALEPELAQIPANASVLDFGCGPGRVLTWFQSTHKGWKFFATDIDNEAISWARANLSHIASFDCNKNRPRLKYDDAYFDFVFSISIFTHLPEEMQTEWLHELRRVVKVSGILTLSVHNEELLPASMSMPESGFYYSVGDGTDGLPDYYQTSFQTSAYINREWSKIFKIEKILRKHIANHQDLVICRRI